ncbi:MAG: Phosphate ABC transporter, periplasmic phosphate-binding protein PstS [uncultured Solirubrobacterales bacterium]|uniref:Phosphate-binding protein n=1 Tax=uncultured Solirubrobacterales bacterium TaxID=768556 RepID=A0A6J4TD94_9ACTN|nr:MAG: Phosphate ABC transporter, periplasmic phosphate-binding protein PstS [uncultured Solirubrobacterales bacterium]
MKSRMWLFIGPVSVLALVGAACGGQQGSSGGGGGGDLSGTIQVDGSSTVQPFAQAAAELFQEENPNVRITVGGAGTGDGFERFCRGETEIADASRAIEAEEQEACEKQDIETEQVPVANDGIAVVTNKQLQVDCMTTDELKKLFGPDAKATTYKDVNAKFPATPAKLFTPGEESGTFDFFTEEALETDAEQRTEGVQTSADDNQLVTGVSGTPGGIGYFGYSFFEQNRDKLNAVAIDGGEGCTPPSAETIQNGSYKPLGRQIFMYPSKKAMQRPEVAEFMRFTTENAPRIAEAAQIVPLTGEQVSEAERAVQGLSGRQ